MLGIDHSHKMKLKFEKQLTKKQRKAKTITATLETYADK